MQATGVLDSESTAVADPLRALGVHAGELRVYSPNATRMELCLFDARDPRWIERTVRMRRLEDGVWAAASPLLTPGRRYTVRADGPDGPRHAFDRDVHLLDPYARGLVRVEEGVWRGVVVDDAFDWGGVGRPRTPLADTVLYEAHVKGLTKQLRGVPAHLRGTYAGLAHEATIGHLTDLGITAVELLPVQAFASERRLAKQGLANYWGYNTVGYFAPHNQYATLAAQRGGPQAVLTEFKGMVRLLHEAGIEVILDVVYNHTAEEGRDGPTLSFRGLDNSTYYRQDDSGRYIDVTGCGNTLDHSRAAVQRLVTDSVRYWAEEVRIDGFRFDLAVTLGRDEGGNYSPESPLLTALRDDPALAGVKLIAEPWDVGLGGWQTGGFPGGWSEWNDRYRDTVRDFWLTDLHVLRNGGSPRTSVGAVADGLAGSSSRFSEERGPLASVSFVTAHDGFTLADLTAYNQKHNLGNGESNRDGTDNNHSFNFGIEGPTRSDRVLESRRRAMRNLLGTLLLSAGVPMLVAGDELGRTQRGNNNAYCHDARVTWVNWALGDWQRDLLEVTKRLIALRRRNPALRPVRYARLDEEVPGASEMHWFDAAGVRMDQATWTAPETRTLQYLARAVPTAEGRNSTLVVLHGEETVRTVTLPEHDGITRYTLLWTSEDDDARDTVTAPGGTVLLDGPSLLLFGAD
ncbi:MAG: glycogen debranching protein GlgX [Amnibacterium sp.]